MNVIRRSAVVLVLAAAAAGCEQGQVQEPLPESAPAFARVSADRAPATDAELAAASVAKSGARARIM